MQQPRRVQLSFGPAGTAIPHAAMVRLPSSASTLQPGVRASRDGVADSATACTQCMSPVLLEAGAHRRYPSAEGRLEMGRSLWQAAPGSGGAVDDGRDAGRRRPAMRQQGVDVGGRARVDADQHVAQVLDGIDAVEIAGAISEYRPARLSPQSGLPTNRKFFGCSSHPAPRSPAFRSFPRQPGRRTLAPRHCETTRRTTGPTKFVGRDATSSSFLVSTGAGSDLHPSGQPRTGVLGRRCRRLRAQRANAGELRGASRGESGDAAVVDLQAAAGAEGERVAGAGACGSVDRAEGAAAGRGGGGGDPGGAAERDPAAFLVERRGRLRRCARAAARVIAC